MNELLRRLLFLPPQASTVAREIDWLHFAVIGTTMMGSFGVAALALYCVLRYRRAPDAPTERITSPPAREIGIASAVLALFLLFWVVGFRQYVNLQTVPSGATEVYVTAKQWMWKFAYPNGRASVGVLAVPVGRPVRLVMTSRDVIHSFYVPDFRVKHDVLPGRYVSTWFEVREPGTHDILCAEYCGLSHSRMRAAVVALAPDRYGQYLATLAQRNELDDTPGADDAPGSLSARGRVIAARHACLACHTEDGQRHVAPSFRGLFGSRVQLADGTTLTADEAYLTRSMMDPQAQVVAGFPAVMPTYQGALQAPEVAALVEYIKSLSGPATETAGVQLPPVQALAPGQPTGEREHEAAQTDGGAPALPGSLRGVGPAAAGAQTTQ